ARHRAPATPGAGSGGHIGEDPRRRTRTSPAASSRLGPSPPCGPGTAVREVQHADIAGRGVLPGMTRGPIVRARGRRGRRTGAMVRIARGRIFELFGLAEVESLR